MADRGDTELQNFDSQFRFSSSPHGDELGDVGDDTFVPDSPLTDTQVLDLDFDSESVDEKEVVLDSEDERVEGTGREAGGCVLNLRKRRLSQQVEGLAADFDSRGADFESINGGKDPMLLVTRDNESARWNCVGSDEPGISSQANAIEFVDQFVSLNHVGSLEGVGSRKMIKKSPPLSWVKGLQSLAKRLGNQSGTFEWDDSNQCDASGGFIGKGTEASLQYGFREQKCGIRNWNEFEGRSSHNECQDEKKIVSSLEGTVGLTNRVDDTTKRSNEALVSQMEVGSTFVEDLGKQPYEESSEQKLDDVGLENDALDMFDIGFSTQMAAEAIEALAHTPITGHYPDDTYQGPLEAIDFQKSKGGFGHCSGLREVMKKSRQGRVIAKRVSRGTSTMYRVHSEKGVDIPLNTATEVKKPKLLDQKRISCSKSIDQHAISGQNSLKSTKLSKLRGDLEKKESLMSVKQKKRSKGDSPVAHRTRHWMSEKKMNRSESEAKGARVNMNGGMEFGVFKIRRKRSALITADPFEVRAREKHPKLSWTPLNTRDIKLSQKEQIGLESAETTSCSELVAWNHPKGKRTCRRMRSYSNGAGNKAYASFAAVDGSQECAQKKQLSVYTRLVRQFSVKNTEGSILASMESSKPNDVGDSMTLIDAAENICVANHAKLIDVPVNYTSFEHHKKQCNKNQQKSSLSKELNRLGISESMPDFTWKHLRRPWGIAYVRVLFSQHLGDDMIKQQKKIMSRLGISVASCSTDATHFVADKFVRTRNMLESIVLGKPVVTHLWLESCGQAGCLIDEKNYILRDRKKEKEIGFSMPVTLARASQYPLLKAKRVFITPSIKPDGEMIASLVKAACGQAVDRNELFAPKDDTSLSDLLILSCEEDGPICEPLIHKGAAAYSSELLLNGIVIQKLEYERHQLLFPERKSTRNGSGLRNRVVEYRNQVLCN